MIITTFLDVLKLKLPLWTITLILNWDVLNYLQIIKTLKQADFKTKDQISIYITSLHFAK